MSSGAHTGMNTSMKKSVLRDLCMQQGWRCFWCGQLMDNAEPESPRYRTLEHVVPLSGGGKKAKDRSNLRAACRECNGMRGQFNGLQRFTGALAKENDRLKQMATKAHEALARNQERQRVTMAGRCYLCKLKFHVKEFLWKRRPEKCQKQAN